MLKKATKTKNPCPHCGSYMATRNSERMSPLTRKSIYECSNFECRFSCEALTEIYAELRPAHHRKEAIKLPVVPRRDWHKEEEWAENRELEEA